jgi:hypothetical protein
LVNLDPSIDIGKKAIIIPGEMFPDYERVIAEEKIEADDVYCGQFGDFGHYPGSWKDYVMNYQLWRVARVLGSDFTETFWAKSCKIDSTDPDNVSVGFSFIYVDGEWEDGQHYELRVIPLGTAKEHSQFLQERDQMKHKDGMAYISTFQGLKPEQRLYRLIVEPFGMRPRVATPESLAKITERLYRRFTDSSKQIVSRVLIAEQ